jgi:FAD/FMN-containing dehydrogenase
MSRLTDTGASTRTAASPSMLLFPGDPGWEDVRRAWNLADDQRPAAIALPRTAEDLVAAIDYARIVGLRVVVQDAGQGPSGEPMDGVLAVSTARMTRR